MISPIVLVALIGCYTASAEVTKDTTDGLSAFYRAGWTAPAAVSFSGNDVAIANTVGGQHAIEVFDIPHGRIVARFDLKDPPIRICYLSAKVIVLQSMTGLFVADYSDGQEPRVAPIAGLKGVHAFAASHDRGKIAVAEDNGIAMVDVNDPGRRSVIAAKATGVNRLYLSDDASHVIGYSGSGHAAIWDVAQRAQVANISTGRASITSVLPSVAVRSPDGKAIAIAYDGLLRIWNMHNWDVMLTFSHYSEVEVMVSQRDRRAEAFKGTHISAAAWSSRGDAMITGDEEGHICLWAMTSSKPVARCSINSFVSVIRFINDDKRIVAATKGAIFLLESERLQNNKIPFKPRVTSVHKLAD